MSASRAFDERHGGHACALPDDTVVPQQRGTLVCPHYHALLMVRRDLHDQVGSTLAGMTMTIDVARRSLTSSNPETDRLLTDLRADVTALMAHVRQLLNDDGQRSGGSVATALRSMVSGMSRTAAGRMAISLDIDPRLDTIDEDVAWAAFWIVREAMTNVLKHSRARHCAVTLSVRRTELQVRVQDDGVGIRDTDRAAGGTGLTNMTARATDQGGWCSIEPRKPSGVAVTAWLPLGEPARQKEVR